MKEMLHLISVFFKEIKFVVNMSITANLAILVPLNLKIYIIRLHHIIHVIGLHILIK